MVGKTGGFKPHGKIRKPYIGRRGQTAKGRALRQVRDRTSMYCMKTKVKG